MFPCNVTQVVISLGVVDFRKHWNGLLGEAERLGYSPYDGNMVVFVKRDKRQIKALCGDDKGLYLFSRRFEGGCFHFQFSSGIQSISRKELEDWFSGSQVVKKNVSPWR